MKNPKIGELELNKVYCMDALEFLKQIPDNSIGCDNNQEYVNMANKRLEQEVLA